MQYCGPILLLLHLRFLIHAIYTYRLCEMCPNTNVGKYGPEKTPYLDTFHAVNRIKNDENITSTYLTKV